jgi:outer membrane lipoprotein-sorting protein
MILVLSFGLMTVVAAETAEQKGMRIAQEADNRDQGFEDSMASVQMLLKDRNGKESVRQMRFYRKEGVGDGDKTLIVFDRPADIQGTAMLTHSHGTKSDDQWMYLPSIKRIKRISSANQSGSFMGSEFAYEDLGSPEVEKYTYLWLRDESCGDATCYVYKRFPHNRHSGYTEQVVWMDTKEYRAQKIEFYDRKKALLKTLVFSNYMRYLDKYWRAHTMLMDNHQTGKATELRWEKYKFGNGFKEKKFSSRNLAKVR